MQGPLMPDLVDDDSSGSESEEDTVKTQIEVGTDQPKDTRTLTETYTVSGGQGRITESQERQAGRGQTDELWEGSSRTKQPEPVVKAALKKTTPPREPDRDFGPSATSTRSHGDSRREEDMFGPQRRYSRARPGLFREDPPSWGTQPPRQRGEGMKYIPRRNLVRSEVAEFEDIPRVNLQGGKQPCDMKPYASEETNLARRVVSRHRSDDGARPLRDLDDHEAGGIRGSRSGGDSLGVWEVGPRCHPARRGGAGQGGVQWGWRYGPCLGGVEEGAQPTATGANRNLPKSGQEERTTGTVVM